MAVFRKLIPIVIGSIIPWTAMPPQVMGRDLPGINEAPPTVECVSGLDPATDPRACG